MTGKVHVPEEIRDSLATLATDDVEYSGFLFANEPDRYPDGDEYVSAMIVGDRGGKTSTKPPENFEEAIEKAEAAGDFRAHYFHSHPTNALSEPNVEVEDILGYSQADEERYNFGNNRTRDPDHWQMIVADVPGNTGFKYTLMTSADQRLVWDDWEMADGRQWHDVGNEVYDTVEHFLDGYNAEEAENPL